MSTENKSENKAKEVVDKFYNHFKESLYTSADNNHIWYQAKYCALICVQELIDSYEKNKEFGRALIPVFNFWNEVKQSIQKL